MSKPHTYGSCILNAKKKYSELTEQGYKPVMVTGHVKVKDKVKQFAHTWVIVGNKIYDPTKSQFDKYGGVVRYLPKDRFKRRVDI